MKIQEMRSGILHLSRRPNVERWDDIVELPTVDDIMPILEQILPSDNRTAVRPIPKKASELDGDLWSVVSFEKVERNGLDYDAAARLLAELDARGVAGLCLVTDAAAKRST